MIEFNVAVAAVVLCLLLARREKLIRQRRRLLIAAVVFAAMALPPPVERRRSITPIPLPDMRPPSDPDAGVPREWCNPVGDGPRYNPLTHTR